MRIAEEHAQMALPEASVGLLPGGTGTQTLPWLVGEGWAKRMMLTNERVDAATALRIVETSECATCAHISTGGATRTSAARSRGATINVSS